MADYLKIPEVARRLDVSEPTVRRMVKGGKLPSVFVGGAYRVNEEDLEAYLENAKVVPGKASAPPSQDPLFNGGREEERRLRYLRAWRVQLYRTLERWEEQPPTTRETASLLDTMTTLVEQGVFDASDVTDPSEQSELSLIRQSLGKLNAIADSVEKDEEAEKRRARMTLIQEKRSA